MARRRLKRAAARVPGPQGPSFTMAPAAGPALLALIFVLLTSWSWRKWGDVFVDFGHELYIPWQLAEGRVLYRDIVYFMGPLSQYFNAAMFRLLGVSFTTLIVVNLAILAGITAAIYGLFARALGRAAGTLVAAVFLCLFGFGHYVRLGNYNYITPYLHEQTHGVALGLLLLVLLERAARQPSTGWTLASGTVLGLAFLTKAEAFVPALASAVVAGALLYRREAPAWRAAGRHVGVFAAGALAPIAAAFVFLAAQMPPADALRGLVGNWVYLLDHDLVVADPFYSSGMGLGGLHAIGDMVIAAALLTAFALGAVALEIAVGRRGTGACVAAGVLVAAVLAAGMHYTRWLGLARALPLVCAAAAALYIRQCWNRRGDTRAQRGPFVLALWSVFALASLGKMILNARIEHYGFALAMPAALLLVAMTVFAIPRLAPRYGTTGRAWQAACLAAVLVGTSALLALSHVHYRAKTFPVASGGDRMYTIDPTLYIDGGYFTAALETLRREMRPDSTLAVLPDGVLLNYLLRRPNPTPYYLMTPWEMRAFGGEEAIFARIAPHAPEYVVLTSLDMSEYGPRHFGMDPRYGARLRLWIEQNYELYADIGEQAGTSEPWMRIYRRAGTAVAQTLPELQMPSGSPPPQQRIADGAGD